MMRRLAMVFVLLAAVAGQVIANVLLVRAQSFSADRGIEAAVTVAFVAIGALLVLRLGNHLIGILFIAYGAFQTASSLATNYALYSLEVRAMPFAAEAGWLSAWVWAPSFLALALLVALFPTGRPASPRWAIIIWICSVAVATEVLAAAGGTWPIRSAALVLQEDAPDQNMLLQIAVWVFPVMFVCLILLLTSIAFRFRVAEGVERQQLKLVAVSGGAIAVAGLFDAVVLNAIGVEAQLARDMASGLAFLTLPVAAGVAILRYRLYEIDVIVNRALVYAAITAILAATYFALVVAFQGLLAPVTRESDLAVAASTLAVAALFGPLRRRIQTFIDRRFYRARYDAQRTLETFSSRLRDEVELNHLTNELVTVVSSTMRPRHVSLWLREVTR